MVSLKQTFSDILFLEERLIENAGTINPVYLCFANSNIVLSSPFVVRNLEASVREGN
jgi:hypothetical protein